MKISVNGYAYWPQKISDKLYLAVGLQPLLHFPAPP